MKRIAILILSASLFPLAAAAQQSSNPVSDTVRRIVEQHGKIMVAAAEEMPANKYSYRPTPQQITFGHLVMHIAESNHYLCSAISGTKGSEQEKLTESDPKDKLVAALKSSFEYCEGVLAKADDSQLGQSVQGFRGPVTCAALMIGLTNDLYDHYSAQAMYLRLTGMLPPTAQHRRGKM